MDLNPTTIHTPRLDLLPLRVDHAAEMAEVLSDPALHTYIGGAPASPEALRTRYERLASGSPDPSVTWLNWVLHHRADAHLLGTVQATVTGRTAEIAWITGTPWQGKGYASEAVRALITWLTEHSVRTITAHIHPAHRASESVARAAGLQPTHEKQDGERRWRLTLPD
ncbi:GNAT family N-acetyltransferase [Streptomyces sp. NPDC092369]|uniref:GNAT family N-acetyltransferase n=1 Tax=Streptomyces sp. NPDC092369 TaxID=3366015 RepID=UPI0038024300